MNKVLREYLAYAVACGFFLAVAVLIASSWLLPPASHREQVMHTLMLFVLTSIFSVVLGYIFTRISASGKVDTIAERSTEKMLALTVQLKFLQDYLNQTLHDIEVVDSNPDPADLLIYYHRMEGAIRMVDFLVVSNDSFRNDWLGVVSEDVKDMIDKKFSDLTKYYKSLCLLEGFGRPGTPVSDEERVEAERSMVEAADSLPIIQAYNRLKPMRITSAAAVQQIPSEADSRSQKGLIIIEVRRDVFTVTGTGKLHPRMESVPWHKDAKIVEVDPVIDPECVSVAIGVGTVFDFHVYIKSMQRDVPIPRARFTVRYELSVASDQWPEEAPHPYDRVSAPHDQGDEIVVASESHEPDSNVEERRNGAGVSCNSEVEGNSGEQLEPHGSACSIETDMSPSSAIDRKVRYQLRNLEEGVEAIQLIEIAPGDREQSGLIHVTIQEPRKSTSLACRISSQLKLTKKPFVLLQLVSHPTSGLSDDLGDLYNAGLPVRRIETSSFIVNLHPRPPVQSLQPGEYAIKYLVTTEFMSQDAKSRFKEVRASR